MLPTTQPLRARPHPTQPQSRDMPPPPRRRRKPRAKCFILLPVVGALTLYAYVVLKHFRPATERQHTVPEWVDDDPKTHFFREEALLHQPTPAPSYSTKTDDAIRSLEGVVAVRPSVGPALELLKKERRGLK